MIASPEYNGSISAAIKNALEWASRPPVNVLKDKVFFVMGCGPGRSGAKGMYVSTPSVKFAPSQLREQTSHSPPRHSYLGKASPPPFPNMGILRTNPSLLSFTTRKSRLLSLMHQMMDRRSSELVSSRQQHGGPTVDRLLARCYTRSTS